MPLGTTLGIGVITYPVMMYGLLRKHSGPVAKFLRAGAISPETARRPESLKLYHDYMIRDAVKRGVLVALEDGRIHVDVPVYRRKRRRLTATLALIGAALLIAATTALWRFGQ